MTGLYGDSAAIEKPVLKESLQHSLVHYLREMAEETPCSDERKAELARKAWWLVLERTEFWQDHDYDDDVPVVGVQMVLTRQERQSLGITPSILRSRRQEYEGELLSLISETAAEIAGEWKWGGIAVKSPLLEAYPGWQEHEVRSFRGDGVNNQCRAVTERYTPRHFHKGLNFRSKGEIALFDELQRRQEVLVFPLPTGCLGRADYFEPDLLVCYRGAWGVLEVDGPCHNGRAAEDRTRDRRLELRGITAAERFTYEECIADPKRVVDAFLSILNNRLGSK